LYKALSSLVVGIVFLGLLGQAAGGTTTDDFNRGNQFYADRAFDSALVAYQAVEQTGVESAELFFNIGNCYFKSGDLGRAVLYFLRAKRLNPSDDDINANLAFTRGFTRIQMEGVQLNPVYSLVESTLDPVSLNTIAWIASCLFILFVLLLTVRYGFGRAGSEVRIALGVLSVLLAVAVFATTFKYRHDFVARRAVVVAEDSPVLSGPTPQAQTELHGAPGLIVEIVGVSGDYYNVLFENKRRGWILKDQVSVV